MRIMIDGLGFEVGAPPLNNLLMDVVRRLACHDDFDCFLLDRGQAPIINGSLSIPFPSYHFRYTADDSILIQKLCEFYQIDLFISTFHSTPLMVPSVCITYSTFPEKIDELHRARMFQERDLCLAYSRLMFIWPMVGSSHAQSEFPEISKHSNIVVLSSKADKAALEFCSEVYLSASRLVVEGKSSATQEFFSKWSTLRRIQATTDAERIF